MRHCTVNVALYGRHKRWAMTERGATSVARGRDFLTIGPSGLVWDGSSLTVRIEEVGMPLPRRIRGTVRLHPLAIETRRRRLDTGGHHRWQPIAPCARVEVALDNPALRWSGPAYFDTNDGDRPLEDDFIQWDWSRSPLRDGTVVLYDVDRRDGPMTLAMRYNSSGGVTDLEPPPRAELPPTLWRVPRRMSAGQPVVKQTLEDTPFYSRSVIEASVFGDRAIAIHESLALGRFTSPWVQVMLPFRMPKRIFG